LQTSLKRRRPLSAWNQIEDSQDQRDSQSERTPECNTRERIANEQ
jgi:hypothetical protein